MRQPSRSARAGFSLIEAMVAATVLLILVASVSRLITGLHGLATSGEMQQRLQGEAQRALDWITLELRMSGPDMRDGKSYPYIFADAVPGEEWALHEHAPAQKQAQPGDSDFGPNRELVYLRPADDDLDNLPDMDGDGRLVWDDRDFSFVVVTGADGVNVLERRSDGDAPRRVARHVERVTFENSADTGFRIPLDAVRVRLWFRQRDHKQVLYKYFVETIVELRNG